MARERLERESLERSEEEEDMLARSTKKFKDSHNADRARENVKGSNVESYKDKLVGAIPGAFAQAFGFEALCKKMWNLTLKRTVVMMETLE